MKSSAKSSSFSFHRSFFFKELTRYQTIERISFISRSICFIVHGKNIVTLLKNYGSEILFSFRFQPILLQFKLKRTGLSNFQKNSGRLSLVTFSIVSGSNKASWTEESFSRSGLRTPKRPMRWLIRVRSTVDSVSFDAFFSVSCIKKHVKLEKTKICSQNNIGETMVHQKKNVQAAKKNLI